jgi:hypothetical protein
VHEVITDMGLAVLTLKWALVKLSGLNRFGETVSETVVRGTNIYHITKNNYV